MTYQWADCDRSTVSRRYDRIAEYIPFFDRLFFLPADLRRKAVARLGLSRGDSVLDIGCGTGVNFPYLRAAVGPAGRIYGVDISTGMLRKARQRRDARGWDNIELTESDVAACSHSDFAGSSRDRDRGTDSRDPGRASGSGPRGALGSRDVVFVDGRPGHGRRGRR